MALRPRISALSCAAALALAWPAWAGSIEVGPILVQMIGPERAATLTVTNASDADETLQVRTVEWAQGADGDVYTPSTSLIASPPVVALKAGESQTIRLVIEGTPEGGGERAYRVILDEIPSKPQAGAVGVRTSIRVLVPVFLTPSLQSRSKLSWSAARSAQGLMVTARNDGDRRERLNNLKFEAGGQALEASSTSLSIYLLSHSSRTWTLTGAPAGASALTATAGDGDAPLQANVPIGQ